MTFKLKKKRNDIAKLKNLVSDVKSEFIKASSDDIKFMIVDDSIKKGSSPVAGVGRYQAYSDSYKDSIRKGRQKPKTSTSPVNLTKTGKMLDSFKVTKTSKGLLLKFTDLKAAYHNFLGAGKSHVIRPMLPIGSEGFKPSINKQLLDLLRRAVDKIIAKLK